MEPDAEEACAEALDLARRLRASLLVCMRVRLWLSVVVSCSLPGHAACATGTCVDLGLSTSIEGQRGPHAIRFASCCCVDSLTTHARLP